MVTRLRRGIARCERALGAGLLAAALAAACMEVDPVRVQPSIVDIGYIQGRVHAGDLVSDGSISARLISDASREYDLRLDGDGAYRIDLPPGAYFLAAQVDGGTFYFRAAGPDSGYVWASADTLRVVVGETIEADFFLGSATIEVEAPLDPQQRWEIRIQSVAAASDRDWVAEVYGSGGGTARCDVKGLLPGAYRMRLESRSGETVWLPGVRRIADADTLRIEVDRTTAYHTRLEGAEAYVEGRVTGSWQAMGVSPPRVSLWNADSTLILSESVGELTGGFCLRVLFPEPFRLKVEIEGVPRWIGGDSFAEATQYDLAPGDAIRDLLVEESGLSIELAASSASDFNLLLLDLGDQSTHAFSGHFLRGGRWLFIPNLDPGVYAIQFINSNLRTDWQTQWCDGALTLESARPVELLPGGVTDLYVTLVAGGVIRGTITSQDGEDWYSGPISIVHAASGELYGRLGNRSSVVVIEEVVAEEYAARGIADGEYKVGVAVFSVHSEEFEEYTYWYPGTLDPDSAGVVTIVDHAEVSGIDITLPAQP
ncbi:MAG: hypothetical protein V1774_09395 [Candidatus Eisenbacteria bacterium]